MENICPCFWIRQYPYNSLTFARHNILADNFVYTICVMVKDKLYAIISCDQPLFKLYFSVWEILQGFYSPFLSLSLSIPFTPLSLSLSLFLSLISPSLSISLLLPFFLSLFFLSLSLAYLMDVFVLFFLQEPLIILLKDCFLNKKRYVLFQTRKKFQNSIFLV